MIRGDTSALHETPGYHQGNVLIWPCKLVGLRTTWPTSPDTEEGDE